MPSGADEDGSVPCGSHAAGHDPHWIQVLRVAPRYPSQPVEDLEVVGTTGVRLLVGGRWEELHNHDPARLRSSWLRRRGPARWTPGARLLSIDHGGSRGCFDLSAAPIVTCPVARAEQQRFTDAITPVVTRAWREALASLEDEEPQGSQRASQPGRSDARPGT